MWKAGTAERVITPATTAWLAGYAHRTGPHEDVLHDIYVRALALEDSQGHRAVLLTADLLKVTPAMRHAVVRAVAPHGVRAEGVALNASHTHSAPFVEQPDFGWQVCRIPKTARPAIERFAERVTAALVEVACSAIDRLVPAPREGGIRTLHPNDNRTVEKAPLSCSSWYRPPSHAMHAVSASGAACPRPHVVHEVGLV